MKIEIERLDDAFHFKAFNEDGLSVDMDASEKIGGHNMGVRPMQLLLMGLGGCSGIDIAMILKKQRQEIDDFRISIEGERGPVGTQNLASPQQENFTSPEKGRNALRPNEPQLWKNIHIHFKLKGQIDEDKAQRAVALSMDKYCSVAKTLEKTAEITYSVSVNQ